MAGEGDAMDVSDVEVLCAEHQMPQRPDCDDAL